MRSSFLWVVVCALFLVSFEGKAEATNISLPRVKVKSERTAKRMCKQIEKRSELVPGSGVYIETCESWNVTGCYYESPTVDKAYCLADILTDDKFGGSYIWHAQTKKGKTHKRGLRWKNSLGPIIAPIPNGIHSFVREQNVS